MIDEGEREEARAARRRVVMRGGNAETADRAAVVEKAKTLGIYEVFREVGIPDDALARAVQWCTKMGAESAEDLSYLQEKELQQLVESLGLPILKQRKLAEKLLRALVGLRRKAEL